MKKYQFLYPALFIKDADDSYQVIFPDLDIFTDGKNLSEAFLYAKDLLRVFFSYAVKYEVDYAKPSTIETYLPSCKENETVMFVDAVVEVDED